MSTNHGQNIQEQYQLPTVEIPVLKFIEYQGYSERSLYVQMNIRSWIEAGGDKVKIYSGFLFQIKGISLPRREGEQNNTITLKDLHEIKLDRNRLPIIQSEVKSEVKIPILFHPHFRKNWGNQEWVEYKEHDIETDLGSYILRVAHSLQYDEGYIDINARNIGNFRALDFYNRHKNDPEYFPTDKILLPSAKKFQVQQPPKKFTIKQEPSGGESAENRNFTPERENQQNSPSREENTRETTRKVKFEIKEETPPYKPREQDKPNFEKRDDLYSDFREFHSDKTHEFYIQESAWEQICDHIDWGKNTNRNTVEQGGILVGNTFIDPITKLTYGVVEQAIPARLAKGSPGYLEITHETWKEMFEELDKLEPELQMIGWYHTHPNYLDVFMSPTDKTTQSRSFGNDWQFAIVLNPNKKIWRAFYGSESPECRGYVVKKNPHHSSSELSSTSEN